MKFYGYGIVWDPENDKPLCEFKDGIYETNVKNIIKTLSDLSYKNDGQETDEPPVEPEA